MDDSGIEIELLLTRNAFGISMILSLLQQLGCLFLQSIDNQQQALSSLILLHSLLDSMSQLLMYMPAVQRCFGFNREASCNASKDAGISLLRQLHCNMTSVALGTDPEHLMSHWNR